MEKNELDGPFFLMIIAVTEQCNLLFFPFQVVYVIFEW